MSVADLEVELSRLRGVQDEVRSSNARALTVPEALAYRNAGNVPDELGRTLRLVLAGPREELSARRLVYEPDFHEAPVWRRAESKPVNVVPLPSPDPPARAGGGAWWDDEALRALEDAWRVTGRVDGVVVPGDLRGLVFKTVIGLRLAGREVTPRSIADSAARWLRPADAELLRAGLYEANGWVDGPNG